jgi:hypothetical protein
MLAGRPHEAAGNGSPRWMTVGPRKRVHRTRPTGRLTPFCASEQRRHPAANPGGGSTPPHAAGERHQRRELWQRDGVGDLVEEQAELRRPQVGEVRRAGIHDRRTDESDVIDDLLAIAAGASLTSSSPRSPNTRPFAARMCCRVQRWKTSHCVVTFGSAGDVVAAITISALIEFGPLRPPHRHCPLWCFGLGLEQLHAWLAHAEFTASSVMDSATKNMVPRSHRASGRSKI